MDWLNEEADSQSVVSKSPWKVVIVDDDYEVFQVTKLALSHFVFEERALELVYASSAEAGKKMKALLSLGASKPWQEALFAMSGERAMDGNALLEYFAPLRGWLKKQIQGQTCGW